MKSSVHHSSFRWNRRQFLKSASAAAGAAVFGVPVLLRGKNLNNKLNIAAIGIGGKGNSDVAACAGENIVALCDVDSEYSAKVTERHPDAKFYRDFRKMFDEMASGIDAVIVATPDHFHAIAASAALQHGKHVYCQKPLTQTIFEARYLRDLARRKRVITQMGNQGSASDGLRRAVECLQAGLIGQMHEVHIWTNRPVWPTQGMDRPDGSDPIPASLTWDTWLGPAPLRPFKKKIYHPFNWRGWQDFGTGALGDMACHTVNMPFRALQLGAPAEIEAEPIGGMNRETYPVGSKIRFQFPARNISLAAASHPQKGAEGLVQKSAAKLDPAALWWYDGGKPDPNEPNGHDFSNHPPAELTADIEEMFGEVPKSGCLILGSKGKVFSPDDYGENFFVKLNGEAKYKNYKKHEAVAALPQRIPRNRFTGSSDQRQHSEWIAAIKENDPALCYSRFDFASQLTEVILLGCVALRAGKEIQWDSADMRVTNAPEADVFLKRHDRDGWSLA